MGEAESGSGSWDHLFNVGGAQSVEEPRLGGRSQGKGLPMKYGVRVDTCKGGDPRDLGQPLSPPSTEGVCDQKQTFQKITDHSRHITKTLGVPVT